MRSNLNQIRSLLLASILLLFFHISSQAQSDRDFILWNTTSLQAPLSEPYYFKVSTKTQYLPDINSRKETYVDFAVYRKMSNWLQLGVAIRGAQHLKNDKKIYEYRPQFISKIGFGSKVQYKTTNRIGYRSFSNEDHYFRYYHNFFIHFPSVGKFPKPYIGEEVFIKMNADNVHLLRAYAGLHLINRKHFKLDTFYALQHSKSGSTWYNANIVGLNLSFVL